MEAAVFGLIGVIVGAVATLGREWLFQFMRNKKDREHLCVVVVCALDELVLHCANVVSDDGTYGGQPAADGNYYTQVATPEFETDALKVEWKSLPAKLMYQVLDIPGRLHRANASIDAAELNASPPYFEEVFAERALQYSRLGIGLAQVATKLRELVNLPDRDASEWDPVEYLKTRLDDIKQIEALRQATQVIPIAPPLPSA
ncbi:hypothetical protein Jab_2c22970 [Janthinobacterium sp. HH01]|uniref:hypothetical protein n=1 Tax=Janthinobacterium sp. HH01 TaxID=1198452 RepID=UPI0002AED85C|nr:hypothetical protein [Janthinobacterium sp. HH01]ELX10210.1 hypothetical protein Jab_2c22970 [Janthinobacterium sp. HH01]